MSALASGPAGRRSRMMLALLAGALLAVSIGPGAALAAKPREVVNTVYGVNTGRTVTPQGTLDFQVLFSDVTGVSAYFAYWGPDQVAGAEMARYSGIEWYAVGMDGNRLFGNLATWTPDHELVGESTYELIFTPAGAATTTETTRRIGNRRSVVLATEQSMSVSGTVTLHDGTVIPVAGAGARSVYETWENQPAATVHDGSQTFIDAAWWSVDGLDIFFRIIQSEISSEAVVVVYGPDGEIFGLAQPRIVDGQLAQTFQLNLTDGSAGGTPVGSATINLAVTSVGSHTYVERHDGYRVRVTAEQLAVSGALEVQLGASSYTLPLDEADLMAEGLTWHGVQRPIKGGDDGGQG
jgi:hypothetical protein